MELMHCLIIGVVLALTIHAVKAHIMAQVPPRLRKHVRRNGMVRGYLVYALERK